MAIRLRWHIFVSFVDQHLRKNLSKVENQSRSSEPYFISDPTVRMRSSANQWLNISKHATNDQRADHIEEEHYDMGMISISAVVVIVCTGPGQFDLFT